MKKIIFIHIFCFFNFLNSVYAYTHCQLNEICKVDSSKHGAVTLKKPYEGIYGCYFSSSYKDAYVVAELDADLHYYQIGNRDLINGEYTAIKIIKLSTSYHLAEEDTLEISFFNPTSDWGKLPADTTFGCRRMN